MKAIYFIIYLVYIKKSIQNYLVFPFRKSNKEKKEYPDDLLQNDLEITIEIGTPPQKIDLNLRSQTYAFFITSSEVKLPYPTFNESNSKTFIRLDNKTSNYWQQEFKTGFPIYETIIVDNKEIKNISLVLATSLAYNETGGLGLRPIKSHDASGGYLSFIYQIKNLANLDNYAFTLRYNDDESGELIIGSYPHLYDKNYKEKNFYYSRASILGLNVEWVLDFDLIKYDNKSLTITTKTLFKIDFGLILAPMTLKNIFKNNFFNNNSCKEENIPEINMTIFHCNKNFNITNFKNLSFILKDIDYNFILTYEELFIEKDDEYIFAIVFGNIKIKNEQIWIFGKPFMKKYQLIYDLDRKIIGIYKGNNTGEYESNESVGFNIYIIFIIVLIVVVIILVIYIIFYIKTPRKNRANELDDDIDYFPTN